MSNQKRIAREKQLQQVRDVLNEFDIETQVNKLVMKSFNDLLRENKQAFQYIQESDKKISLFQTRLCKLQGFNQIIQKNVATKFQIANNLNKRLELFVRMTYKQNKQFFEKSKQNQTTIQLMRKDFDHLISNTQKNTFQIRNIGDLMLKFQGEITKISDTTAAQLQMMVNRLSQNQIKLQKQVIQLRQQSQNTMIGLATARAQLSSKSNIYQQVSKDISLYKHEKDALNNRINDIFNQLRCKLSQTQFNQMRISFDSQMVTEKQYTLAMFKDIRLSLKQEIKERRADDQAIRDQHQAKWKAQWKIQQQYNTSTIKQIQKMNKNLQNDIDQTNKNISQIHLTLKNQLQTLDKRQKTNYSNTSKYSSSLQKRIQSNLTKINDNEKNLQARYEQICQISSNIQSLNQSLSKIIQQNNERKRQMKKLQTKANIGQNANQFLQRVNEELIYFKTQIINITTIIKQLQKKNINLQDLINQKQIRLSQNLSFQKVEFQNKCTQINRRINQVSIQIMNNLNKVQIESKNYVDQFKISILGQIQFIHKMSDDIGKLQIDFQKKMLQTQAVNQSISEKMEKSNMGITKFKSDMIIKMEAIVSQQQRRSAQVKQLAKIFQQSRKLLGFLTQSTQIILTIIIHRQNLQQTSEPKEAVKMSSLSQGWVIQMDQKVNKYRGELILRKKMATVCLNSLINYGDKIKGYLIESGKDVYNKMHDETQQIFSTKKKTKSMMAKIVPQLLPKLHF